MTPPLSASRASVDVRQGHGADDGTPTRCGVGIQRWVVHILGMEKPTSIQNYYLVIIAWMRWFGVAFAVVAALITASNLPWLLRSNDMKLLAVNLAGGAAFILVGLVLYRIGTAVERRYRTRIPNRLG